MTFMIMINDFFMTKNIHASLIRMSAKFHVNVNDRLNTWSVGVVEVCWHVVLCFEPYIEIIQCTCGQCTTITDKAVAL